MLVGSGYPVGDKPAKESLYTQIDKLSIYLSISLSVSFYISLFICLLICGCLSNCIYLAIYPPINLSVCVFMSLLLVCWVVLLAPHIGVDSHFLAEWSVLSDSRGPCHYPPASGTDVSVS